MLRQKSRQSLGPQLPCELPREPAGIVGSMEDLSSLAGTGVIASETLASGASKEDPSASLFPVREGHHGLRAPPVTLRGYSLALRSEIAPGLGGHMGRRDAVCLVFESHPTGFQTEKAAQLGLIRSIFSPQPPIPQPRICMW